MLHRHPHRKNPADFPGSRPTVPTDCLYSTPVNWPLTQPWSPDSKVLANHTVKADNTQPQHYKTQAGSKNEVKRRGNALPQTSAHMRAQIYPATSAPQPSLHRWRDGLPSASQIRGRRYSRKIRCRKRCGINKKHNEIFRQVCLQFRADARVYQ